MKAVTDRLKLKEDATLAEIYAALLDGMAESFEKMTAIIEAP